MFKYANIKILDHQYNRDDDDDGDDENSTSQGELLRNTVCLSCPSLLLLGFHRQAKSKLLAGVQRKHPLGGPLPVSRTLIRRLGMTNKNTNQPRMIKEQIIHPESIIIHHLYMTICVNHHRLGWRMMIYDVTWNLCVVFLGVTLVLFPCLGWGPFSHTP